MSYEIEVVIIDDGIAEPNEYFLALLTLIDPQLPGKVTISPDLATVTIVDGKSQIPIHQCCRSQCSYSSMGILAMAYRLLCLSTCISPWY